MVHEGCLSSDDRHRIAGSAGRQLGEPTRVLRVLLFRHGAPVRRRTVEPGQVSLQVELAGTGLHWQTPKSVRRPNSGALHGVSGTDRCLPVRVDVTCQDLHRRCEEDRTTTVGRSRRGGDVLQHLGLRTGAGLAGDGVGRRDARRPAGVGRCIGSGVTDPHFPGIHQFRCSSNGFGDRGTSCLGAPTAGAGRDSHRAGRLCQALPGIAIASADRVGRPNGPVRRRRPHYLRGSPRLVCGQPAGAGDVPAWMVGVLPPQHQA